MSYTINTDYLQILKSVGIIIDTNKSTHIVQRNNNTTNSNDVTTSTEQLINKIAAKATDIEIHSNIPHDKFSNLSSRELFPITTPSVSDTLFELTEPQLRPKLFERRVLNRPNNIFDDSLDAILYYRCELLLYEKNIELTSKSSDAFKQHNKCIDSIAKWNTTPYNTVSQIEYIVNPVLLTRFENALAEFPSNVKKCFAWHGSTKKNYDSIMKQGFLIPGEKGFIQSTDRGYYGAGCYFSPNIGTSFSYARYSGSLLLCCIILGRQYNCTHSTSTVGMKLVSGYDSHCSSMLFDGILII